MTSYRATIETYCTAVLAGTIPAGRLVVLAVRRHLADLEHAAARGLHFDEPAATEAIRFIETCCRHSKGEWAGQPVTLAPFQRFIVWSIFGWRRADGTRRFRKVLIELARKNGKSTLCAALALLLLIFDRPAEPGAEIYTAATKRAQAKIIHDEAWRMCKQSPALAKRVRLMRESITIPASGSSFIPLGADGFKTDGLNPHGLFLDELHAWRDYYREYHEKLTTAGGARRQPLTVTITTAGDEHSTLWIEQHAFAVRVLESVDRGDVVSDEWFCFLAAIDQDRVEGQVIGDDPFASGLAEDDLLWMLGKANPALGVSIKAGYLLDQWRELRHTAPGRNAFLRYHANVAVESSEKAISASLWAGCGGPLSELDGRVCYGGFDIGRSDDFAAITLVFPFDEETADGEPFTFYETKSWSFTTAARSAELDSEQFDRWVSEGRLIVCPGDQLSFQRFEDQVIELGELYEVRSWAFDPTFAAHLAQTLESEHGRRVFRFTQAAKYYNEPLRKLLAILKARELCHGDDPLLAWQAGNLCIKRNERDEWMPDKIQSSGKIDAMVSLLMALSECLFHAGRGGSKLVESGARFL